MDITDNFEFKAIENSQKDDDLKLVPEEVFTEETNPDKSKKFICKQCDKDFKSVRSVKQRIAASHKKALKRAAETTSQFSRKLYKKTFTNEDFQPDPQSTQYAVLNETSTYCRDLLADENVEGTFNLDDSIEQLVEDGAFHSTAVSSEGENDILTPDQDHDYVVNDIEKAKLISMEIELKNKNIAINEKDNELKMSEIEISNLKEQVTTLKKELFEKDQNLNIAVGKNNSSEEELVSLKRKLMMYSAVIKKLRGEKSSDSNSDDKKENDAARKSMKEKNKKLAEAESRGKLLAQKLAELESMKDDNLDDKYKKVNDKLTTKTKDLKKVEKALSQAEDRTKELLDIIHDKNKKISELENSNSRLKLMENQAQEMHNKVQERTEKDCKPFGGGGSVDKTCKSYEKSTKKKCKYENTGTCRRKDCKDFHPSKTCQPFSKLGSCPLESLCEHRHPFGVCYDWERYGSCPGGETCRYKHPFDIQGRCQSEPASYGSPRGLGGLGQGQEGPQQGSHQGYHDMRGNRW